MVKVVAMLKRDWEQEVGACVICYSLNMPLDWIRWCEMCQKVTASKVWRSPLKVASSGEVQRARDDLGKHKKKVKIGF